MERYSLDELEGNIAELTARTTDQLALREVLLGDPTADTNEVTVRGNRFAQLGFHAPGQDVEQRATRVAITIPFSGSQELLFYQPQTFDLAPREATVRGQTVTLERDFVNPQTEQVKAWRDEELRRLTHRVGNANGGVASFNNTLKARVVQAATDRVARLQSQQSLKHDLNES